MQFDFGQNWQDFSKSVLAEDKVNQAREDFNALMGSIEIRGKSFLDIGFGQGLSLLIAAENGAIVVGNDINPKCAEVLQTTAVFFQAVHLDEIPIHVGSILEADVVDALRRLAPGGDGFDIVHSWGVLHHTGDMRNAIEQAILLLKPGGILVIAIYNRHWSSPVWRWVKRLYCGSPCSVQRILIGALYPVIWIAKWLATGENPKIQDRGMDFYFNVVDWVGGYPYEYASITEVSQLLQVYGLKPVKVTPCKVPTGCNEYVYRAPVSRHPSNQ